MSRKLTRHLCLSNKCATTNRKTPPIYVKKVDTRKKFSKLRPRTKQKLLVILSTLPFSGTAGKEIFKNARCFTSRKTVVKSPPESKYGLHCTSYQNFKKFGASAGQREIFKFLLN